MTFLNEAQRQADRGARRQLFGARKKIVKKLQKFFRLSEPLEYEQTADNPDLDPLWDCCMLELPETVSGRIALYHRSGIKAPRFSSLLLNFGKASAPLEEVFEEAMEMYAGRPKKLLVGVVFEVNGEWFVYCSQGAIESASLLIVRYKQTIRFIYSLEGYVNAMKGVLE